ncbi:MAG TPA: glycosyltransferase family 4 protein [Candidatus Competibacteraceae bacterium]|nr:glycosyltransferase family 4 protein [Candidatus Competibacteraceae bacterium]
MTTGLRVVQILPALDGGGVERGTLEVARALVAAGHRSVVISAGGRLVEPLLRAGSEHLSWPLGAKSPLVLRWVWPLRRWLQAQRIDILHARSRLPAWVGWLAWRGMDPVTRPRFVTTVHGLYSVSRYSAVMTYGERVIAVSETVRDYILRHYPATDPARIRLIYRGVDPAEFPHGYRPGTDWLADWYGCYPQLRGARVLTLAGRLTRLKGHEDFIRLIAALRGRGLAVHGLVVGGEDPRRRRYATQLREQVRAAGLAEAITFTGHRSDLKEIYAISDLVLSLSSKPESFGRTVLEALALGVPVLGYAHGGVGEILARLFPAGAVTAGDESGLVERAAALLADPLRLPPVTAFRLQDMLDQTLELYQALCARP